MGKWTQFFGLEPTGYYEVTCSFCRECFRVSSRKFTTISVYQGQQAVLQAPAQEPHAFGACKERSSTYEQKRVITRMKQTSTVLLFYKRSN
jgi:hypothetical protein